MTIYKACKRLDINYSTGKSIIKSFKRTGVIFQRKMEKQEIVGNVTSKTQKDKEKI